MASERQSSPGVIVAGIDPGLRVTGFGLIQSFPGIIKHVSHGVIRTASGNRAARLLEIYEQVSGVLSASEAVEMAIEQQFVALNARTAFVIGEARAAAMLAAATRGIPVFEYTPAEIKQSVTSYGRSGKQQVQEMVRMQFGLASAPQPADAADALAIAICHACQRERPGGVAKPFADPIRRVAAGR